MVIVEATPEPERAGALPDPQLLLEMGKYNEELSRAAGLTLVGALASEPSLARYHLLSSVRADLLYKLGRPSEARTEFQRAAALTRNNRERQLLLTRAASCETNRASAQGK